jgi:hypothetical protein
LTRRKSPDWTGDEQDFVRQYYGRMPLKELIARYLPRRNASAVIHMATRLGVAPPRSPEWEPWEDELVRRHYRSDTHEMKASHLPHRTIDAISARARILGRARHKAADWTKQEEALIREHYPTMRASQIREQYLPHRSTVAILQRARDLGFRKIRRAPWTRAELDLIRREFLLPGGRVRLMKRLGCSEWAVRQRAQELGLYVPEPRPPRRKPVRP